MSTITNGLHVRVAAKTIEATDICSFELVSSDGGRLPHFSAGSHIDIEVPGGPTRQYSLCNDSDENHRYLIAVLRDAQSRGGSAGMHDRLQVGDLVAISSPKNHFQLVHDAKRSVLLAGGIGVTPILCMAERLSTADASFDFHYCARSRDRAAFVDRIAASPFGTRVQFHNDDGASEQRFDMAGAVGRPEAGTHLYVCGPKGFMDAVLATARSSRWPEAQLHYEFFAGDVKASQADTAFEVKLASSGRVIAVQPSVTVVRALADAGVEVPTSCEQGVCGTCLTRVLEGTPDHRDMYLTPEEQAANDQFLPCCSRSKSDCLVLDL